MVLTSEYHFRLQGTFATSDIDAEKVRRLAKGHKATMSQGKELRDVPTSSLTLLCFSGLVSVLDRSRTLLKLPSLRASVFQIIQDAFQCNPDKPEREF